MEGSPYDQTGPFWVVYEDRESGIYDSWPKAKYQVKGVSGSYHKNYLILIAIFGGPFIFIGPARSRITCDK